MKTVTLAAAVLCLGGSLQGQSSLSYIPLDHRAMPFLEYLVARGVIEDPSPLERPWVLAPMLDALERLDPTRLSARDAATARSIRRLLETRSGPVVLDAHAQVGVRAATHARRDPLREAGPRKVYPFGDLNLALQFGPGVLVTNPEVDPRALKWDPDYTGRRDEPLAGRFKSAYAAYRARYFEAVFGVLDRNWGPPELPGVLVSPVPYSYTQLFVRAGPERARLQMLVAQLDDMSDNQGVSNRRYWIISRFAARPIKGFDVALWQGTLISGPDRSLEFWYLNPLRLARQAGDEESTAQNSTLGLDLELRFRKWPRIGLSFLLDDLQVVGRSTNDEPPSYAFTVAVAGPVLGGTASLSYTQVSNLAYRTPNPTEAIMRRGIGLGRNFSDYDRTSLDTRWLIAPGMLIGPEFTLLRQGEGDFRQPFPPESLNAVTPTLFAGTIEYTWRAAMWGKLLLPLDFAAQFDAGVHRISNFGHAEGETRTRFVGSASLSFRFRRVFGWR